jgi:hypothetical protein
LNGGVFQFVHHGMASQRGMVCFDIQFEVVHQIVRTQEVDTRCGVTVVLGFGGLLGFGFDQKLAREANFFRVVNGHV